MICADDLLRPHVHACLCNHYDRLSLIVAEEMALKLTRPRASPDIVTFGETGGVLFGEYMSVPVLNLGQTPVRDLRVSILNGKKGNRHRCMLISTFPVGLELDSLVRLYL